MTLAVLTTSIKPIHLSLILLHFYLLMDLMHQPKLLIHSKAKNTSPKWMDHHSPWPAPYNLLSQDSPLQNGFSTHYHHCQWLPWGYANWLMQVAVSHSINRLQSWMQWWNCVARVERPYKEFMACPHYGWQHQQPYPTYSKPHQHQMHHPTHKPPL